MCWGRGKSLSHFEVFVTMQLRISFFWDIMLCQRVGLYSCDKCHIQTEAHWHKKSCAFFHKIVKEGRELLCTCVSFCVSCFK